jgi:hypothetical protein
MHTDTDLHLELIRVVALLRSLVLSMALNVPIEEMPDDEAELLRNILEGP